MSSLNFMSIHLWPLKLVSLSQAGLWLITAVFSETWINRPFTFLLSLPSFLLTSFNFCVPYTQMYVNIHTQTHTYTHTHSPTHTHTRTRTHTHTHTTNVYSMKTMNIHTKSKYHMAQNVYSNKILRFVSKSFR